MKPVDFNNINKIDKLGTGEQVAKKKSVKGGKDFSEIFEAELGNVKDNNNIKVDNMIPTTQLLNIKPLSDEKIFIEKGLSLCNEIEKIFTKMSQYLKENKSIKGLIGNLDNVKNELLKVSENINDNNAKDIIDKAVFMSNIEVEKYTRGDYL